jgi:putative solute:sodium symporter small subunit
MGKRKVGIQRRLHRGGESSAPHKVGWRERVMAEKQLTSAQQAAYWHKTRNLMWLILAAWFVFSFVIHIFAPQLNNIRILGFPMGYYMAAQGSLIAFVLMCVWNAKAQDRIDNEFGVQDE